MQFAPDEWNPALQPTPVDMSSMESLKLTVWRSDPEAQIQVHFLYDGGDTSANKLYFDDGLFSDYDPVPAGEWYTIEIPMADMVAAGLDPSTFAGIVLASHKYRPLKDGDGNLVDHDGNILADDAEPVIEEYASGETIYMSDVYFSKAPDAPHSVIEEAPVMRMPTWLRSTVTSTPPAPLTWMDRRPSAPTR